MLYDKKWDQKTDPFTMQNLIAWLETKPPDEEYAYLIPRRCLLGQFAGAMGAADRSGKSCELSNNIGFASVAFGGTNHGPFTFGAALKRALAQVR